MTVQPKPLFGGQDLDDAFLYAPSGQAAALHGGGDGFHHGFRVGGHE
jgi:hypothetical protein